MKNFEEKIKGINKLELIGYLFLEGKEAEYWYGDVSFLTYALLRMERRKLIEDLLWGTRLSWTNQQQK